MAISSESQREFRTCLAQYPTGICVVTVRGRSHAAGMTLNSFISVSLDPCLVLISLANGSRTATTLEAGARFTISFLQRWQAHIAHAFARSGAPFPTRLVSEVDGHLEVRGALAVIRCTAERLVPGGDHVLVIGDVSKFDHRDGEPLVFYRGRIGGMHWDLDSHVGGWDVLDLQVPQHSSAAADAKRSLAMPAQGEPRSDRSTLS